ncbi:MAG: ATP-binding protein [Nitriliruptorales bacterium]|nr:ATP-binding protein [Nitriliruptorales bacterium]
MSGDSAWNALDALPEGVLVIDDGGRIIHANDRARLLLELSDDSIGQSCEQAVELWSGDEVVTKRLVCPAPVGDRLAETIVTTPLRDGRDRALAVAGRRLADGTTVLTFRSAGSRLRLEAARSDLVATVSHEIRSPLTSVKGFTRTMLLKWDRFRDDQKQAMLETINEDADRVTRLLSELLDVSRIDAGRVQLHRTAVAVDEVIAKVVDGARHRGDLGDRIITTEGVTTTAPVHADPDKLAQVISNLLENAIKYAGDSDIRIGAVQDGDVVVVTVADDGPGIASDQHRRIFEKFGRARGQRGSGTGLGLYITRGLVRAHGGSVDVDSDVDAGARFHVRLPVMR